MHRGVIIPDTHTHTHMAGEVLRTVKCELVTLVEPFHERQPLVCRNIIVLYAYTSTYNNLLISLMHIDRNVVID